MSNMSRAEMIEFIVTTHVPMRSPSGLVFTESGLVPASERRRAAETLRAELSALDSESLSARYETFIGVVRQKAEEAEAALSFNQPYGRANFDHWAKMEYWTVDEGIALLLGRSPHVLEWDKVKHIQSPVVAQFAAIREAAQRAVHWKTLSAANRPGAFILWAKRFEYPMPKELEDKVEKYGHFMGDWYTNYKALKKLNDALKPQYDATLAEMKKTYDASTAQMKASYDGIIEGWKANYEKLSALRQGDQKLATSAIQGRDNTIANLRGEVNRLTNELKAAPAEKPLGPRERDTLRKLVIGLAIGGYGYDPSASRSEIPAQIASDLQVHGLAITDDTVRKHLREAAELLPPPDSPERMGNKR